MMRKRMKTLFLCLAMLASLPQLAACDTASGTSFTFSFSTSEPSNSYDSKAMTVPSDMAKLTLQANLTMDVGTAAVTVRDASTGVAAWERTFEKGEKFVIELPDVKKDATYLLEIAVTQGKQVNLIVTTGAKLVENPAAPPKPAR